MPLDTVLWGVWNHSRVSVQLLLCPVGFREEDAVGMENGLRVTCWCDGGGRRVQNHLSRSDEKCLGVLHGLSKSSIF